MEPFGAAAVGEVGDAQKGLEIMGEYTAGDDLMHMCYAFEFLANDAPDAAQVVEVMSRVDEVAGDGWPCWAFSNHDVIRHATRWNFGDDALRAMTTLMMCWRGTACIYQGEELGLSEADVAFEDLQDPYGIEFWPEFKGRDGCRTPMVWEPSNEVAGFSAGRPWLPVSADHLKHAVASQEQDPDGLIHHYRRAIAFRQAHPVLAKGDHDGVKATGPVVYFTRSYQGAEMFCAINLSGDVADVTLPSGDWRFVGQEIGGVEDAAGTVRLDAWKGCFAVRNV